MGWYSCIVLLVLWGMPMVFSGKILLSTIPQGSHLYNMLNIGKELNRMGHETYIVTDKGLPESVNSRIQEAGIHRLTTEKLLFKKLEDDTNPFMSKMAASALNGKSSVSTMVSTLGILKECANEVGEGLIKDKELNQDINDIKFDLAIVDDFPPTLSINFPLVYKHSIPYITLGVNPTPHVYKVPFFPSYIPNGLTSFSTKMNFAERIVNFVVSGIWPLMSGLADNGREFFAKNVPEKPPISFIELQRKASVQLLDDSDELLDTHQPLIPQTVPVGGLSIMPTKPLPQDLETFMNGAKDGVIVLSFGTYFAKFMTKTIDNLLLGAFRNVPQKVVWQYYGDSPQEMPERIKLMKWIPQNDLLAHNNTKLFISHCGTNSVFEGIYHSIPILCIPFVGHSPSNAARVQYKGYGLSVELFVTTSEELKDKINLMTNESFKSRIQKASNIFRNRPMNAVQKVGYYVGTILKFGDDHLKSDYVLNMPWYQYLMIDIFLFFFILLHVLAWVLYSVGKCIYRKCTNSKKVNKSKVN